MKIFQKNSERTKYIMEKNLCGLRAFVGKIEKATKKIHETD
jgi:hypothetical protein